MMRYALAKPRFLKTSLTLAAVMATSLLMASSALAWSSMATTPASSASTLNAVSCVGDVWTSPPSSSDCYLWGNYTLSGGTTVGAGAGPAGNLGAYTLGYAPAGFPTATIRGVDCAPFSCAQVGEHKGYAIATGSNLAVALAPAGALTSRLNAVSCIAGGNCVAVGQYTDSAGHSHGYVAMRSGPSTWSVVYQYQPTETLGESALTGVSCVDQRCYIVGTHTGGNSPLAIVLTYTWSTGAITTATLPTGQNYRQLNAISCVDNNSQTKCEAVGSYKTTSTGPTIPLYLQSTFAIGSTSTVAYTVETGTPAAPAGATTTRLNGTSCLWDLVNGFRCRVVGDSNATGAVQPYIGTLTTGGVSAYGATASATGTSCYRTSGPANCYDVGTSTTSGVTQAIYQAVVI
jgi:hypothetical protein